MGLELFEQLGWRVPDVILYPTGGGVGLIGIYKALLECQASWAGSATSCRGWSRCRPAGCAPIVRAWEEGAPSRRPWQNAATIAFGVTVPKPLGDFLILDAVRRTGGCAIAVDDEQILAAQARLAAAEGAFICPEGAACVAAAEQLRKDALDRRGRRGGRPQHRRRDQVPGDGPGARAGPAQGLRRPRAVTGGSGALDVRAVPTGPAAPFGHAGRTALLSAGPTSPVTPVRPAGRGPTLIVGGMLTA